MTNSPCRVKPPEASNKVYKVYKGACNRAHNGAYALPRQPGF